MSLSKAISPFMGVFFWGEFQSNCLEEEKMTPPKEQPQFIGKLGVVLKGDPLSLVSSMGNHPTKIPQGGGFLSINVSIKR